jgi:hypothetical protein
MPSSSESLTVNTNSVKSTRVTTAGNSSAERGHQTTPSAPAVFTARHKREGGARTLTWRWNAAAPTAQVALVTCRVRGPSAMRDIDSAGDCNDVSQFSQALTQYTELVRTLLMRFYGYECKEPDRGNFTLCFCRLEDALAYCVTLQVRVSLLISHHHKFRFIVMCTSSQRIFPRQTPRCPCTRTAAPS